PDMTSNACSYTNTSIPGPPHYPGWFATSATFSLLLVAFSACNHASPQAEAAKSEKTGGSVATTAAAAPKNTDLHKPVIQVETTAGPIPAQLDGAHAPGTVRNFVNYATEGFYENTLVHYVDPGRMVVAGGYSADRKPKSGRTPIRNEAHNGVKNLRGTIA